MNILDLLRSDGSIVVNKYLARKIGLNEAVILSELISRSEWHKEKNEDKQSWFYCTQKTLEEQTSLNRYYQDKAIDELIELGLIDKKTMGVPAKRYFYINRSSIVSLVTNKNETISQTRKQESDKLESDRVANKKARESQEVISINNNQNNTHKQQSCPIYSEMENQWPGTVKHNQLKELLTYKEDGVSEEMIIKSIEMSADKKFPFGYCKGILNNCLADDITDVSEMDNNTNKKSKYQSAAKF